MELIVGKYVPPSKPESETVRDILLYELKYYWRYLHRRYSTKAAAAVNKAMKKLGEESSWSIWRAKDFFYPRLLLGVFAGFLLLYASGEMWGFLSYLNGRCEQSWFVFFIILDGVPALVEGKYGGRRPIQLESIRQNLISKGTKGHQPP